MGWIKRNLFFVIGGIIALLLLGAAGFYNYQSWDHNSAALTRLNEIYATLQQLGNQKPSPGNAKVNNIQTAKDQELQVKKWIDEADNYFVPIKPVPDAPEVSSEAFASALRRTIDQLQREAVTSSVQLPPKYGFSFEAQRWIVRFAPGSLAPLAVQLGEVKTISEILFAAHVNSIDGIQRVRVSDDDTAGPQTDYLNDTSVTNDHAVLTPYVITFRGFSSELGAVLAGFASSPNGFIVNGFNVAPAGIASQIDAATQPGLPPVRGQYFRGTDAGMPPPSSQTSTSRGGLTTVLKEQLLRITLKVEVVKPLPKK